MRLTLAFLSALSFALISLPSAQADEGKATPPPSYKKKFNKNYLRKRFRRRRKIVRALTFTEYGNDKPDFKKFQKKIQNIKERETIRLDITLKNNEAHFPEGSPCKGTEWGSLYTKAETTYHLMPIIGNINLIFEILPGSRESFPYTSISCVYNPTTPQQTYVRFTGFFVVHHHIVPSAVLHEFRAITKPAYLN